MGLFTPEFEGQLTLERLPDDFTARIQRRVQDGLFVPGRRDRANYRVTSMDRDAITFVAEGLLTRYNVGLNEVTVRRGGTNQLQYHVSYWGWTRIAVCHGLLMGLVFLLCYALIPGARAAFDAQPSARILGGSIAGFFCLAWPWVLTALHRRPAEGGLQNILRATLSGPPADRAGDGPSAETRRAS